VIRPTEHTFKGPAAAFRALNIGFVVRGHKEFLKEVPALNTSKLEDGHCPSRFSMKELLPRRLVQPGDTKFYNYTD
jgi:hypothetical protein